MDVPAPLSASALERAVNKVNLRANGSSELSHLLVSIPFGTTGSLLLFLLSCSCERSRGHFGLLEPLVLLRDGTLSFLVFIEIFLSIDFVDPSLWSDLKQSCRQEWQGPNCHAGGAFVPGQTGAVQAHSPERNIIISIVVRVLWFALAEVGQSIHAPGNLSGKGSNQNGKEVRIVEEPLEHVEVFGGNLSAIDFIEEHEEDEGDEDILFMLFERELLCGIRSFGVAFIRGIRNRGVLVIGVQQRTPAVLKIYVAWINCILHCSVFIVVQDIS